MSSITNRPAPGVSYFTPAQVPPAGTAYDPQLDGRPIPKLFQPIKIRGTTFHNRIFVGAIVRSLHLQRVKSNPHLGGIFTRGPGLSIIEATAVAPEGRITPEDTGLWKDSQADSLRKIVEFAHSQNQKVGIQLAHAGRKESTVVPWLHRGLAATERIGGWPDNVLGPSTVPFNEDFPIPKELSKAQIKEVVAAFASAAKRVLKAGVDVIEIHNAHGYLLFSFLSPQSNKRTDEYGGSFENRIRLTLEVVDTIRDIMPTDMPLFLRVSATEWLEEALPDEPSWRVEDTVRLASILAEHGVDFLDVSSGGSHPKAIIKAGEAYQALAHTVKQAVGDKLVVGSVGSITNGVVAQEVLDRGQADVVLVGRFFQKSPAAVWSFASDLGVAIKIANQIAWGFLNRSGTRQKIDWWCLCRSRESQLGTKFSR